MYSSIFTLLLMTLPFLTLNSAVGDIKSLIVPAEPRDIKTKLQHPWTLWIQIDPETKDEMVDYDSLTKESESFESIEAFWGVFNEVPQPSVFLQGEKMFFKIESGSAKIDSIMLFRQGVKPQWEDPANASGGHFQFHWKPNSITPGQLDEYWNNLVLAMIGNTIESEGEFSSTPILQGLRFVDKMGAHGRQAGVRIEVWFGPPTDPRHLQKVKSRLEKAMALRLDGTPGTVPRCDIRYHSKRA